MITAEILGEISDVARNAENSTLVHSEKFIYFAIQPSFEELYFQNVFSHQYLKVFTIKNYKNTIIGYVVWFVEKPLGSRYSDYGASLFFGKINPKSPAEYDTATTLYSDQKFRLVAFDSTDFFASVKWKSQNPMGEDDGI